MSRLWRHPPVLVSCLFPCLVGGPTFNIHKHSTGPAVSVQSRMFLGFHVLLAHRVTRLPAALIQQQQAGALPRAVAGQTLSWLPHDDKPAPIDTYHSPKVTTTGQPPDHTAVALLRSSALNFSRSRKPPETKNHECWGHQKPSQAGGSFTIWAPLGGHPGGPDRKTPCVTFKYPSPMEIKDSGRSPGHSFNNNKQHATSPGGGTPAPFRC